MLNYEYIYQQWAIFSLDIRTVLLKKPQLYLFLPGAEEVTDVNYKTKGLKKPVTSRVRHQHKGEVIISWRAN